MWGEWIVSLGDRPEKSSRRITSCEPSSNDAQIVRLEHTGAAYAWDEHARFSGTLAEGSQAGYFTTLGSVDAVEIATPSLVLFAFGCGNGTALVGTWHDANAERQGCFSAVRNMLVDCATANGCHSTEAAPAPASTAQQQPALASAEPRTMVTHRLRLGMKRSPSRRQYGGLAAAEIVSTVLLPEGEPGTLPPALADGSDVRADDVLHPSPPPASDVAAAAAINASAALLWRATGEPTGALVRQLRALLDQPELAANAIPTHDAAAKMASAARAALDFDPASGPNATSLPAGLPAALDWRTHRGGGWLSPPTDMLTTLPHPCVGATHVVAAVASVEARIRIRTEGRQSERLSAADALACTPYMGDKTSCRGPHSAYLVGKYGREFGFARHSCVPWTRHSLLEASQADGNSSSAAEASQADGNSSAAARALSESVAAVSLLGRPQCSRLASCDGGSRRRRLVRSARFVGGHYGRASASALLQELQSGPVAVTLTAEPSFALYRSGVYHPPQPSFWRRMKGRTLPPFDVERCHSGCAPPSTLEWRDGNLGALLVGYGTTPEGVDYWIVRLPWGPMWGEAGDARVWRSDASIAEAVVIEAMV